MDGFSRHQQQQHGGGAFWYTSSSSPPPPAGYHQPPPPPPHLAQNLPLPPHPPAYHHQPSYTSQLPITPPLQHQPPQPWYHPPQQPAPPLAGPPPNYPPPYHSQPGLPPPYLQPQHRYPPPPPPPQPHPMAAPPAYPPSIQAWGNPSWQNHQLWEYPDRNIHCGSEEDWAAKARAWASADSMTENHHGRSQFTPLGRTDEHEYAYHDHLPKFVAPAVDTQLPLLLQSNGRAAYTEHETETRESSHLISPPRSYYPSSSIYEQEVPYTYSSSQGSREAMDHRERPRESFHSQFTAPIQFSSVEEPHFFPGNQPAKPSSDISDQPLDFQPKSTFGHDQQKQFSYSHVGTLANEVVMDQNAVGASVHAWSSTTVPVATFPPIPLAPSGTQYDPSFASQASHLVHSTPAFGGIAPSFQAPVSPISAPFGLAVGASLHATDFPGDGNGSFNISERPRKAAVPNWLREELIKKKSAIANTNVLHSGTVQMEDADMTFRKTDQADNQSLDSRRSTEDDDDDEDEVEAARSAAINQEIKRVLTEVLLKVTDELFDEIATKVLDEVEPSADVVESTGFGNPKLSPPTAISTPRAFSKIPVPVRADSKKVNDATDNSSPNRAGGDLLGLGNYGSDASDDDDDDDESQGARSRKLDSTSHHLETASRSYEHAQKDVETVKEPPIVDANGDVQKERLTSFPESSERKKVVRVSETAEKTSSMNSERPRELQQDAKYLKSKATAGSEGGRRHESVNGDRTTSGECRDGGAHLSSANKKPERILNDRGLIKEVAPGSNRKDNENNKHGDKQNEKISKSDKMSERGGDRNVKQATSERDTHPKSSSRNVIIKDSNKEILKDKGERKKDYDRRSERKRDRKDNYKKDEEDKSEFARETLRRNFRSKSPVRKHAKDNSLNDRGSATSEESSDNSRKRKLQLRGTSLSASPRSKRRQASRSPHSKHSHSRHSPHSSVRRNRRSRSISPAHRRRPSKH